MADAEQQASQGHEQRQAQREAVDVATSVIRPGRAPQPVRLVDISALGFHARFHGHGFTRGEQLQIDLPQIGLVRAQVMWGLKGCFGCKFDLPIDARLFMRLLITLRICGDDWQRQR